MAAGCFDVGSCGVHSEEAGEATRLTVYFEDAEATPEELTARLEQGLRADGLWPEGAQALPGDVEPQRDWNEAWRAFYRPVQATQRIVVHPPWIPVDPGPDGLAIAIDPAMAFGTGGHESTQLALEAIEATDCRGKCCLDVGAGSGVLSIALLQLGAEDVVAIDIDPVVVDNARHNLQANLGERAARAQVRTGSIDLVHGQRFEVIVANLESHLVRPLLPGIVSALAEGGWALFSGLVERERDTFCGWLEEAGLRVDGTWAKNDWFSCAAGRAG